MSDAANDTIPLTLRDAPQKCCHLMTTGSRKKKPRGKGSYTTQGRQKRIPCPNRATRLIKGKPYCSAHGPSKFRIDPFYDSATWRNLRKATLDRDGHKCRYCGNVARQADHVIPRSKGGVDDLSNLVACCADCNKLAGGNLFSSFAAKKKWIVENRVHKKSTRPTAILDAINRS